jgi:hypothetical protein
MPCLSFSAQGQPAVIFVKDGWAQYGSWEPSGWKSENIKPVQYFSSSVACGFDHQGNIGAVLRDNDIVKTLYLHGSPGNWEVKELSIDPFPSLNGMAFDSLDQPAFCYVESFDGGVWWARLEGTTWITEEVEGNMVGDHCTLRYSQQGQLGVIYDLAVNGDIDNLVLKYAKKTIDGWQREVVDQLYPSSFVASLAFDSDGQPAISYRPPLQQGKNQNPVRLARNNGSQWAFEDIATPFAYVDFGCTTSLAFDENQNPTLVYDYYEGYNHNFVFARRSVDGWILYDMDQPSNGIPSFLELTHGFDSSGEPLALSFRDDLDGHNVELLSWK